MVIEWKLAVSFVGEFSFFEVSVMDLEGLVVFWFLFALYFFVATFGWWKVAAFRFGSLHFASIFCCKL